MNFMLARNIYFTPYCAYLTQRKNSPLTRTYVYLVLAKVTHYDVMKLQTEKKTPLLNIGDLCPN